VLISDALDFGEAQAGEEMASRKSFNISIDGACRINIPLGPHLPKAGEETLRS
jgi:hypothetical protein